MTEPVAIVGPRGSSKSVLTLSLELALRQLGRSVAAYEGDIYSSTHLFLRGEITAEERQRRKIFEVDWAKARATKARIVADTSEIVLVDMAGGRFRDPPYADRDFMLQAVCAAILVGRYRSEEDGDSTTENWERLMGELDIPIITRVHSLLPGQILRKGFVGCYGLDRERGLQPNHPAVQVVAGAVISWTEERQIAVAV